MLYIEGLLSKDEHIVEIFKLPWGARWLIPLCIFVILFVATISILEVFLIWFIFDGSSDWDIEGAFWVIPMTWVFGMATGGEYYRTVIAITSLGCLILWIAPPLCFWFHARAVEQGVTNKRLILKTGIVARNSREIQLDAIESIQIRQGPLARIIGYGKVIVTGRGVSLLTLRVADPMQVKTTLQSLSP